MTDYLATALPVYLTYKREIDPSLPSSSINSIRRIFREALILYPALFALSGFDLASYSFLFGLAFIVLHSIYEMGYVYNDWIRVKYESNPTFRRYIENINPAAALTLRGFYITLLSLFLFSPSYICAVLLLASAVANHNRKAEKYKQLITLPLLRTAKYMFIPIAFSNFDFEFLGVCLTLLTPLLFMEGETIAGSVIRFYAESRTTLQFKIPYYVWFLTFLPFQALLLLKYSPLVLSGELVFMAISAVRHR